MRKIIFYLLLTGSFTSLGLYVFNIFNTQDEPQLEHKCGEITYGTYKNDPYMESALGESGSVAIYNNYYKCNKPKIGDLVYYEYSKGLNPILRIVEAVPGDQFELIQIDDQTWHVMINNNLLQRDGEAYLIKTNIAPVLKRLARLQNNTLKENEYLLFTHSSPSKKDSSEYGIVMLGNLVGRVIPNN